MTDIFRKNVRWDSDQWIDLVIVLDKGLVGYAFQAIMAKDCMGWLGDRQRMNLLSHLFMFISSKLPTGEKTLNQFFLRLMAR
jgi:hypothetical protein